jgi:hypothetical protein
MADDKQDRAEQAPAPRQAAREAQREVATPAGVDTFTHEWLIEAAAHLGFLPHEVAGALSAIPKKNLTIEEAREATKVWLATPVKEA